MPFDPIDFAITSAREAFDQKHEYGGIGKSIMVYTINVRDTLSEYDRMDALDDAMLAFCRKVAEISPT